MHANNFLVQNVTRALGQLAMTSTKFLKTFSFLQEKRDGMILEWIQSEDLCKIHSGAGDKKASGVSAKEKLNNIFGKKYRISLHHQILSDHCVFYPQPLYNDLVFELTLASASHVVKGSDATKLKYKLTNTQLEYEMIHSKTLADEAKSLFQWQRVPL